MGRFATKRDAVFFGILFVGVLLMTVMFYWADQFRGAPDSWLKRFLMWLTG